MAGERICHFFVENRDWADGAPFIGTFRTIAITGTISKRVISDSQRLGVSSSISKVSDDKD